MFQYRFLSQSMLAGFNIAGLQRLQLYAPFASFWLNGLKSLFYIVDMVMEVKIDEYWGADFTCTGIDESLNSIVTKACSFRLMRPFSLNV